MIQIKAKIVKGIIYPNVQNSWDWTLKCYEGKDVNIHFKEFKDNRTLAQNRLYWLYIGLISSETGEDKDRLHKFFKKKFLPVLHFQIFGEPMAELSSTTNLDTKEFTEYLRDIESLTDIQIPDVWLKEFEESIK